MMTDRAEVLARMAAELATSHSETATASAAVARGLELVADADAVSLTLRGRRGTFTTLASTDGWAAGLDELQYVTDEGPCIDAANLHDWYRAGDVAGDSRWPRWGPLAGAQGVRALLSVSLSVDDATIGALNFYSRMPGGFGDRDDVDLAILYATHAALALSSSREVSGLETAVLSRHLIGVAQGILMERYDLDLDRSFALLQRCSNRSNVKLVDLAREVVSTGFLAQLDE
jgi:GAF domain-containing protein